MSINGSNSSLASYGASLLLTLKGCYVSACEAWAVMPLESKIGVTLGLGTFVINWYYKRRRDRREEAALKSGRLVEVLAPAGVCDDD